MSNGGNVSASSSFGSIETTICCHCPVSLVFLDAKGPLCSTLVATVHHCLPWRCHSLPIAHARTWAESRCLLLNSMAAASSSMQNNDKDSFTALMRSSKVRLGSQQPVHSMRTDPFATRACSCSRSSASTSSGWVLCGPELNRLKARTTIRILRPLQQ